MTFTSKGFSIHLLKPFSCVTNIPLSHLRKLISSCHQSPSSYSGFPNCSQKCLLGVLRGDKIQSEFMCCLCLCLSYLQCSGMVLLTFLFDIDSENPRPVVLQNIPHSVCLKASSWCHLPYSSNCCISCHPEGRSKDLFKFR